MKLQLEDKQFGELLPLIQDENVTDITWNGKDLWVDDLTIGRYKDSIKLDDAWVNVFATKLANLCNEHFNYSKPLLEADTDSLRISIIHPNVANDRYSIAIRKTPPIRRITEENMVKEGYTTLKVIQILEALVKSGCSFIIIGEVGAGKTEFLKFLTKYLPNYERTITIEDNYELRLAAISPELDVVEIKVNESTFDYRAAIKASLRQKTHNLFLSEARSKEIYELLEAASTGCRIMTTLHCDDVRKVPDRVLNMLGSNEKENDVFLFFDVVVKISSQITNTGVHRQLTQIALLDRNDEKNSLTVLYDKGELKIDALTPKFKEKFDSIGFQI